MWVLGLGVALFGSWILASSAAHAEEEDPNAGRMAASRATIETLKAAVTVLFTQSEAAHAERDMLKLNFLNEKIAALKGLLKIVEQADLNLQEALLKHDGSAALHEEEKLAIAVQKAAKIGGEAAAWAGNIGTYSGETRVEMDTGEKESVHFHDTTTVAVPTVVVGERPPAASPYQ